MKELEQRVAEQTRELAIANEALRESERNSQTLLDSIPGLVALLSADGHLQFVNRQILEYTGRTLEELKQWGTNDTVHPEDLPHVIEVFTQSIASGNPYEIVQRLRRSDGAGPCGDKLPARQRGRWFSQNFSRRPLPIAGRSNAQTRKPRSAYRVRSIRVVS